jgi:predicted Zn-dependent protease
VTDYGDPRADKLSGLQERSFQIYGNSPSRPVDFPAFDGFAAQFGWAIRRTTKPLRSLQTVLLSPAPLAEGIAAAFVDSHIADDLGERMLDDSLAADTCLQAGEATRAARLLERCVRIDPENADLQRRLAEALLEVPEPSLAIDTIRIGQALRDQNRVDWDFLSGRAECLLGRRNEAITAYQASAAREDHPSTRTNLGILYEELGDCAMAAAQYQRALELRPDYSRATDRLAQLKELTWENLLDEARAKSL